MISYFRLLLTKRLLLIFVASVCLLIIGVNLFLFVYKSKVQKWLTNQLHIPISIGSINYSFPNTIVVNRLRFFNISSQKLPAIFVKKVSMPFSLSALLAKRLDIKKADISGVDIFNDSTAILLSKRGKYVIRLINSFSGGGNFYLNTAGEIIFNDSLSKRRLGFINHSSFKKSTISTRGSFTFLGDKLPLIYKGSFVKEKNGLIVDAVEIIQSTVYSKLWGRIIDNELRLNGLVNVGTIANDKFKALRHNKFSLSSLFKKSTTSSQQTSDWAIYDLEGVFLLNLPKITTKSLTFTLGTVPVGINATTVFGDQILSDIVLDIKPVHFNLSLNGLRFGDLGRKKLTAKASDFACTFFAGNAPYTVKLSQVKFYLFSRVLDRIDVTMQSDFYGGSGELRGYFSSPSVFNFQSFIQGADSSQLSDLLWYFKKVDGRVNGDLRLKYLGGVVFSGDLDLRDGALNDFNFFAWLADTFRLNSLRNIDYDQLSLSFLINKEGVKLENINLKSPQAILDGYYNVRNSMLSSKVSLGLERGLLKGSPKFSPLVNLLGKHLDFYIFDFQLSGLAGSPNFKWLESEFKNRLKRSIPGFIERGIERKVEDIISSAVEK